MLKPALALVSINMTLNSLAFASPSSIETCLHNTLKQSVFQFSAHAEPPSASLSASITLPFVNKISLIADKHNDHIAASLSSHFLYPACGINKGLTICTVDPPECLFQSFLKSVAFVSTDDSNEL